MQVDESRFHTRETRQNKLTSLIWFEQDCEPALAEADERTRNGHQNNPADLANSQLVCQIDYSVCEGLQFGLAKYDLAFFAFDANRDAATIDRSKLILAGVVTDLGKVGDLTLALGDRFDVES